MYLGIGSKRPVSMRRTRETLRVRKRIGLRIMMNIRISIDITLQICLIQCFSSLGLNLSSIFLVDLLFIFFLRSGLLLLFCSFLLRGRSFTFCAVLCATGFSVHVFSVVGISYPEFSQMLFVGSHGCCVQFI